MTHPGSPGLSSIPVSLGTWQFAEEHWGPFDAGAAKALLRLAVTIGIHSFDTAESYGRGRSEQLIGQTIATLPGVRIATKSVVRYPHQLRAHLDLSLRRIGVPAVEDFYIHWTRGGIPLSDAVHWMEEEQAHGRIHRIGASNLDADSPEDLSVLPRLQMVQTGYNLIWRREEHRIIPHLRREGVQIAAYSPFAQGLLAHRFSRTIPAPDHRSLTPLFSQPYWDRVYDFQNAYHDICDANSVHPAALALLWLVQQGVDQIVFGVHSARQLNELDSGVRELLQRPAIESILKQVHAMSDALQPALPALANMFGYTPVPLRTHGS